MCKPNQLILHNKMYFKQWNYEHACTLAFSYLYVYIVSPTCMFILSLILTNHISYYIIVKLWKEIKTINIYIYTNPTKNSMITFFKYIITTYSPSFFNFLTIGIVNPKKKKTEGLLLKILWIKFFFRSSLKSNPTL